ncbi:MAG: SpoIIE family protein phosphatase [Clostridia bacterium]|nr:SpoIIE family protein phosphatase [Clostridia bacterium]
MPLKINLKSVILYAVYTAALILMNKAIDGVPLSVGLYFAMLLCGTNIIATPILYVAASAVHLNWIMTLLSLFEGGFLCAVAFLYRRTKRKIKFEGIAYIAIALSLYIPFAPWKGVASFDVIDNEYALKAIAAAVTIVFSFFCFKTVYAVMYRVYRCRLREDELVCCAVTYTAIGTGLYNLTGYFVYTAFAAGLIVFCVRLARSPAALIAALVAAIPPAVVSLNLIPLTVYLCGAVLALLFANAGRVFPSIVTLASSTVYLYFTGGFNCAVGLIIFRAVLLLVFMTLPAIPSAKFFTKVKNSLLVKEVLPDTAVERNRRRTGEKLYRISEVFREIECAFNALDEDVNEGGARARMLADLREKCCKNCTRARKCANTPVYTGFRKLIDTGCVKGKVSLIDLPSEITLNCAKPADLLAILNSVVAEYRRYMTEAENAKSGRILLADQARGIAEVMKACAVELSKSYSEYSAVEEQIKLKLSASGISCPELFISGDDMEICAVICGKINLKTITDIISDCTGKKCVLKDRLNYDGEKSCLVFGAPPALDAAFGVAFAVKNGEKVSGDTHSVIRINEHSFLMALSDGMGSGEYAKKISATAISLIEAFYRAEMPEGTVLKTINKLLSFNRDERFACIDIAAVNLNTGVADFVKIGSPAGIIVREGEIKVLESQSLPLGILENLRPNVCSEQLKSGDIVVFMSDGITSAFPSYSDLYEFLQGLNPLNPQNLADKILAGALARCNQTVADDMTVLCTRIFSK